MHLYLRYYVVYRFGICFEESAQSLSECGFALNRWRVRRFDDYVRSDEREGLGDTTLLHRTVPRCDDAADRGNVAISVCFIHIQRIHE